MAGTTAEILSGTAAHRSIIYCVRVYFFFLGGEHTQFFGAKSNFSPRDGGDILSNRYYRDFKRRVSLSVLMTFLLLL